MAQSSSKQDAFNAARIYVTQTLLLWKLYGQLFRTSEDYIKVLNDGAPHFFGFVQEAFVVDIACRDLCSC
jgi:hypothetical protein